MGKWPKWIILFIHIHGYNSKDFMFSISRCMHAPSLSHVQLECSPPARLFCPWNFPGKITGMSCHSYTRRSSWPRDRTRVSCTGRWILYHCTSWEAHFTMTKPVLLCCAYWLSLTLRPMDFSPQAPLSMGVLQARILEWVAMPSSRESSQPQGEPKFLVSQADSLLLEPPGEPKNTGVVSLYWSG